MSKKQVDEQLAGRILEHARQKHSEHHSAWSRLIAMLGPYEDDPEAFEALRPELLRALAKWSKLGQDLPDRWLLDPARFGHLFCIAQQLSLTWQSRDMDLSQLAQALAQPMPRLRRVDLSQTELTQQAFEALCANASLTEVISLKLAQCGMRDAWMPALLSAPALWTSLNELMIADARVSAKSAALLADSPVVAKLNALSLKGSPIGDTGRRALGASPYLSDKAKGRSRAKISATNEAAQEAPPAPRDVFGDLRSLVQAAPCEHTWELLCDLFDRLEHSPERERVSQELIPYARASLERWPEGLRPSPISWLEALMDGKTAPAALQLADTIHIRSGSLRADRLKQLANNPALCGIRRVHLAECSLSNKALTALLSGSLKDQLSELVLECNDQALGLIKAVCGPSGPPALKRLTLLNQQHGADELKLLADAPFSASLRHLNISVYAYMRDPAGAILALPFIQQLESLELPQVHLNAEGFSVDPQAAPAQLRTLVLSGVALNEARGARLGEWLARCERLEELTLRGLISAQSVDPMFKHPLPAGLKRLDLDLGYAANQRMPSWTRALPAALEALTVRASHHRNDQNQHVMAALSHAASSALTALTLVDGPIDARALRANPLTLRSVERLSIVRGVPSRAALGALRDHVALPALRALRLSSAPLSIDSIAELFGAPWWHQLESLGFVNGDIAPLPDGGAELGRLLAEQLPASLTALDLKNNSVSLRVVEGILKSRAAPNLRALKLSSCSLEEGSLARIVEALPSLKQLERLELGHNSFSQAELIALATAPQTSQLSRIGLCGCRLNIKAQQALLGSAHMTLSAKDNLQRMEPHLYD